MPYSSVDELPASVKKLGANEQRQWMNVWNSAFKRCSDKGGTDCEASAFAQANGVVKASVGASFDGGNWGKPPAAVAAFDMPPAPLFEADDMVYRRGPIWRAGDYPDKGYAMTVAENHAAVEAFKNPVPVDLEHVPTVLSGKLGELVSVHASDDGQVLEGIVAMPKWLDQAIGDAPRKVSATWNRASKQLEGLALVLHPRVSDAALMAAFSQSQDGGDPKLPEACYFYVDPSTHTRYMQYRDADGRVDFGLLGIALSRLSQQDAGLPAGAPREALLGQAQGILERARASVDGAVVDASQLRKLADFAATRHDTSEGQMQLQMVHDTAAHGGAVCKSPDQASMASQHEAGAMQQVHDICAEHGAKCSGGSDARPSFTKGAAQLMTGIRERFLALFSQIPEEQLATLIPAEGEGAAKPPAAPATTATATAAPAHTATAPMSGESDRERQLREQLTATQDENRRIRAERIAEQAATFADMVITGWHKAFPTEKEAMIQAYVQAATDDLLLPGNVTFADGKAGSRVGVLKATYEARPPHQLTAEQLAPGIFAALANRDATTGTAASADKPLGADQIRDLIGRTTLGQSMLDHADRGGVATEHRNGKS